MSEIYIVAGPPRSGTSVTAGILHALGVNMGVGGFMLNNATDEWNLKGHFADREFHAFTTRYLSGLDRPRDDWEPDHEGSVMIAAMIQSRSSHPKWGIKGLHSWVAARVLSAMGLDVRLIVCDRPIEQSQASFQERTFDDFKADAPSFVEDTKVAVESLWNAWPQGKRHRVVYADLFDATESTLQSLADFVGLPLNDEARNMIDPNGRRFG